MPDFSNPFVPQHFSTPTKPKNLSEYETEKSSYERSPSKIISQNNFVFTPSNHNKFNTPFETPKYQTKHNSFNCFTPSCFNNSLSCSNGKNFSQQLSKACREFEPTIPMDIELHSTKRAQEREIFEEKLREQERWKEARIKEEEEEAARREMEEIKMIRKNAEFKARPAPNFKWEISDWGNKNPHDTEESINYTMSTQDMDMMDLE